MTGCEPGPDAIERAARESYGKLLSHLAARFRDIAAAEDALGDAFAAALVAWRVEGVPTNPEGWLFAAARRRLIDRARRARAAQLAEPHLALLAEEAANMEDFAIPDSRLGLMFACADPSIEPSVRTALMLQVVLGFSVERIAPAYLMTPAGLGQRLVRAKRALKAAAPGFHVPDRAQWPARLPAVLEAIYAAYGEGYGGEVDLASEAIWLGRVLVGLVPEEPEALGLLSLMLYLQARSHARRDHMGRYVPLEEQDVRLWRGDVLREADGLLKAAGQKRRLGRFQLEAAIQSVHASRLRLGDVDWGAILALYDALADLTQSPVVSLNRAAVVARVSGPAAGLDAIEPLAGDLRDYQSYWALRAHLLCQIGDEEPARAAYLEAISRTHDRTMEAFLRSKLAALDACASK
jgi:RNA polymerase sigma-70 factor (ECF subfamily)